MFTTFTLLRDPSIMKHTDGRYYVAYTTNWGDNRFGVDGVANSWAPERFVDTDGTVSRETEV